RRHHPRPRPRARRDDGRDHGDRQPRRDRGVAVRAVAYDGERRRQRVRRGRRRPAPLGAVRDRPAPLRGHAPPQRRRAAPGLARGEAAMSVYGRRKAVDVAARALCILATALAILPLVSVLFFVGRAGVGGLSLDFFTNLPAPVGEVGGGMKNAIVGTLICVGLAASVGIPLGVMAGVYLSEFGDTRFGRIVRFSADVMSGVPSIAVGIFVYTLVVLAMGRFSALAGGVALAVLMLPTITRTTEEFLRLVPSTLREAALALGVPKWRVILRVVLVTAAPGIMTGVMLAVARAAGETAP